MTTDSQCFAPGISRPASAVAGRDHLVSARVALFDADLALAMGNSRAARIHIDLAQAYLAEIGKDLQGTLAGGIAHDFNQAYLAEKTAQARVDQARQAAADQTAGLATS